MKIQMVTFPTGFDEKEKRAVLHALISDPERQWVKAVIGQCAVVPASAGMSVVAVYVAAGKAVIVTEEGKKQ